MKVQEVVANMTTGVLMSFRERIATRDWLDQATIERAQNKVCECVCRGGDEHQVVEGLINFMHTKPKPVASMASNLTS